MQRVFYPSFLLFHLGLGRCADLDDSDAAGELRQPFLQLFTIVIGGSLLHLRPELLDSAFDALRFSRSINNCGVVFRNRDSPSAAKVRQLHVFKLGPHFFHDGFTAHQSGNVFQHGLTAIAEAWRLDSANVNRSPKLVDDERGEGFAFYVFRDDEQRLASAGDLLEHRQKILHAADLFLLNQ